MSNALIHQTDYSLNASLDRLVKIKIANQPVSAVFFHQINDTLSMTQLALKLISPSVTMRHNPSLPPLSSLNLSIISVDIHWWWMGPICKLSLLHLSITLGSPQLALTWAPPPIPGGTWNVNPFFNMSLGQLPLDEINALSHPSCYLLLPVIDAFPTCMLPGQSDMVMKTYALVDEEADNTVE